MNKIIYTKTLIVIALAVGAIAVPGPINCQQNYNPIEAGFTPELPVAAATASRETSTEVPVQKGKPDEPVSKKAATKAVSKPNTAPSVPYENIIVKAANTHQIDPALIKAIIMAESRYDTKAVSKKGAKGLMQLMPVTAKSLGVVDSFNPEDNINGGVKYFKRLLDRFEGDVTLALAAYNAGSRYVRKYGGVPPFRQTRTYINKVFRYHKQYKPV